MDLRTLAGAGGSLLVLVVVALVTRLSGADAMTITEIMYLFAGVCGVVLMAALSVLFNKADKEARSVAEAARVRAEGARDMLAVEHAKCKEKVQAAHAQGIADARENCCRSIERYGLRIAFDPFGYVAMLEVIDATKLPKPAP
jgi:uncharacterized membrane protein YuzA (DUF378 family)